MKLPTNDNVGGAVFKLYIRLQELFFSLYFRYFRIRYATLFMLVSYTVLLQMQTLPYCH